MNLWDNLNDWITDWFTPNIVKTKLVTYSTTKHFYLDKFNLINNISIKEIKLYNTTNINNFNVVN